MQHVAPVQIPQLEVGVGGPAKYKRIIQKNEKTGEDEEWFERERKVFKGHYLTWLIVTAIFIAINVFITVYAVPLINEATDLIKKADKALHIVHDIEPLVKKAHDLIDLDIKPMVQDGQNIVAQANAAITEVRAQYQELRQAQSNLPLKNPGPDSCQYNNDGACDEPQFCALGTDTADCLAAAQAAGQT